MPFDKSRIKTRAIAIFFIRSKLHDVRMVALNELLHNNEHSREDLQLVPLTCLPRGISNVIRLLFRNYFTSEDKLPSTSFILFSSYILIKHDVDTPIRRLKER